MLLNAMFILDKFLDFHYYSVVVIPVVSQEPGAVKQGIGVGVCNVSTVSVPCCMLVNGYALPQQTMSPTVARLRIIIASTGFVFL